MLSTKTILYYSDTRENEGNTFYPHEIYIDSVDDLRTAVSYDHVCAKYRNNYRNKENFIQANCTMLDIDNTDSDDPADWISPAEVRETFPDVIFYVVFSKNHMKKKGEKSPRPRFHVYFPDRLFYKREEYEKHKDRVCRYFPAFDHNAKDSARFFYGVENPEIEFFDGDILLSDFMEMMPIGEDKTIPTDYERKNIDIIPEGTRHCTLISHAARVLKRWGETEEAYHAFEMEYNKCVPLLGEKEVDSIWKSACKFYHEKIESSPDYLPPRLYEMITKGKTLKPDDFTDMGQTNVFVREYGDIIRFSLATGYLYYNGKVWIESETKVHHFVQSLTEDQLKESIFLLNGAQRGENNTVLNDDTMEIVKGKVKIAERYRKSVLKCRHTSRITAVLTEAKPMVEIKVEVLDKNGFMLNTPDGIVNLHTGKRNSHNPLDYCTKITGVKPDREGMGLFQEFLDVITCSDRSLQDYLQFIAGMCLIGKVYCENLIIAYGVGKNGKSTFFNLISRVMGDYSGNISAEVLTKNSRMNKKNEFAELRGKRLVIASELEDGKQLDTTIVKQLCSTDAIYAEKKYKDPFSFTPTHTTVLCTNHLPSVGELDNGTWRRLVVVPFQAVIDENTEMKNYADHLFQNAGGAILSWMIKGAQRFIEAGYKISQPEVVKQAIEEYRRENNWIYNYLSECCESDRTYSVRAGKLYENYRDYCDSTGEPKKSQAAFKKAMLGAGYRHGNDNKGSYYSGVKIKSNDIPYISHPTVTVSDGEIENFSETEIIF